MSTEKTRTLVIELPEGSRLEGLFDAVVKAHKQRLTNEAAAEEQEKAERIKAAAARETYRRSPLRPRGGLRTRELTEQQIAAILFERGTAMTLHTLTRPTTEFAPYSRVLGIDDDTDELG